MSHKGLLTLQNFLCMFKFSLYSRKTKIISEHMHKQEMRMSSRHCTEQRHTKISRYSPWCEVSIVPRLEPVCPPDRHPPFPLIRGEQLNLQVTCGIVDTQQGLFEYPTIAKRNPPTPYKLSMKSFKTFVCFVGG